jgi:hypothetical protein
MMTPALLLLALLLLLLLLLLTDSCMAGCWGRPIWRNKICM